MTKEQREKLRMLVECHNEDNDELGQAARELLPLLDDLAAEQTEPLLSGVSRGPGPLEDLRVLACKHGVEGGCSLCGNT
jgi:hypothetical protein